MWDIKKLFSTTSIIDQLIENKAESKKCRSLTKYFQNFEVKDLLEMDDPFELIGYVEPVDRFSMQLFLQGYLVPLLNQRQKEPEIINTGLGSKFKETLQNLIENDKNYKIRETLLFKAMCEAKLLGLVCGIRVVDDINWPVLFTNLPTGEISWHIEAIDQKYSGYSTQDKFDRINKYIFEV